MKNLTLVGKQLYSVISLFLVCSGICRSKENKQCIAQRHNSVKKKKRLDIKNCLAHSSDSQNHLQCLEANLNILFLHEGWDIFCPFGTQLIKSDLALGAHFHGEIDPPI